MFGLLFAACALLAGCDSSDPPLLTTHEVHLDTMNGIIHVHNEGDGLWTKENHWRPRTDWALGDLSGEWSHTFGGGPYNIRIAADGAIHYLAFGDQLIRVFAPDGTFLRALGGVAGGEGPGDLAAPISMAWDAAGSLWVADFSLLRYTIFDRDGAFDRVVRRPIARAAPNLYQSGYFDRAGNFVDETVVSEDMGGESGVSFVRVSPEGEVVDTLPPLIRPSYVSSETATRLFLSQTRVGELNYYRPHINWDFGPDDTLWFTTPDPFRLVQRTLKGDTLRIVTIDHRSGEFTSEDEERVAVVLRDPALNRADFTLIRRIARGLHVLDGGHVLVQVEENPGEDSSLFDVFDPEGRLLGTIDLGFPVRSGARFGSLGNTLAIPTSDSLGVPKLVRITLDRP